MAVMRQWAAAREVLKRAWHPFHLKYFFSPARYNQEALRRRVTELLNLARKNEIGRPYALTEYAVAEDLLTMPFIRNSEKGISYSLFILRSLRDPAAAQPKDARTFFRVMTGCYESTITPEHRKESLELIIRFLKSRPPDKNYAEDLWLFLHRLDEKTLEKPEPYIPRLPYDPAEIKRMNTELEAHLCLYRKTATGTYGEKAFNDYMRRHGIRCGGDR